MISMITNNPVHDAAQHDLDVAAAEAKFPVCDICGKTITDEKFHILLGVNWCDECIEDGEVFTDDFVEG